MSTTCPTPVPTRLEDNFTKLRQSLLGTAGDFWWHVLHEDDQQLVRTLARGVELEPASTLIESAASWLADHGRPFVTNLTVEVDPNAVVVISTDLQDRIVSPGTSGSVYIVRFAASPAFGGWKAVQDDYDDPVVDSDVVVVPVSPDTTDAWRIPEDNRQVRYVLPIPSTLEPLALRIDGRTWVAGLDFDVFPGALLLNHAPPQVTRRDRFIKLVCARRKTKCVFNFPAKSDGMGLTSGEHVMTYLRDRTVPGTFEKALAEVASLAILPATGTVLAVHALSAGYDYVFDYGRVRVPYAHTALTVGQSYEEGHIVGGLVQVHSRTSRADTELLRYGLTVAGHGLGDGAYFAIGVPHSGQSLFYLNPTSGWILRFEDDGYDGSWYLENADGDFQVQPEPFSRGVEHPWQAAWPGGATVTKDSEYRVFGRWWAALDWSDGLSLDDICPVTGVRVPNQPVACEAYEQDLTSGKLHVRPMLQFPDNDTRNAYWGYIAQAEHWTGRYLNDYLGILYPGQSAYANMLDAMFEMLLSHRGIVIDINRTVLGETIADRVVRFAQEEKPVGSVLIIRDTDYVDDGIRADPGADTPCQSIVVAEDGVTILLSPEGYPFVVSRCAESPLLLATESGLGIATEGELILGL